MPAPEFTKLNHYIPASIIGAFSSNPHLEYLRKSVVAWGLKGEGMKEPATAERRFCLNEFYTLPRYQERWRIGLMLVTWNSLIKLANEVVLRDDSLDADLEALADRYCKDGELRQDVVEGMLRDSIDGPFAGVAARLRAGETPDEHELDVCREFLSLLFLRGPAWFKSPTATAMTLNAMMNGQREANSSGRFDQSAWADPLMVAQKEILRDLAYPLLLAVQINRAAILDADRFAIELLIAKRGGPGFVLGDNAGRVYSQNEDPRALSREAKGIEMPGSVITFPIGPRHCLRVVYRPTGDRFQRIFASEGEVRRINTAMLTLADRTVVFPEGRTDVFMPEASVLSCARWVEP